MVTVKWSAASLIHYSFLNPVKPLHLRSMLSKSMRCTENCNACSLPWSTERVQFFSTSITNCMSHNQWFKIQINWVTKFCLIHHIYLTSHQLTVTSSSISTTFCREILPQLTGGRKCFPKIHWNPRLGFLCYRNKQTYFSLAKLSWLQWLLFWLIQMCLSLVTVI